MDDTFFGMRRFNIFLLTDTTGRSKYSSDQKRLFIPIDPDRFIRFELRFIGNKRTNKQTERQATCMVTWKRLNTETAQHGIGSKIRGNPSKVGFF